MYIMILYKAKISKTISSHIRNSAIGVKFYFYKFDDGIEGILESLLVRYFRRVQNNSYVLHIWETKHKWVILNFFF